MPAAGSFTARDTLASIRSELAREIVKAAWRGLPLANRWAIVRDALASGRLTDELPGGFQISARTHITKLAKRYSHKAFLSIVDSVPDKSAVASAGKLRPLTAAISPVLKVAGPPLGMLGAGVSLYRGTGDIERYQLGKLDVSELSARLTFRGTMFAGGLYSAIAVTGGPAGILIGGSVIASEMALDHYDRVQDDQLQRTLTTLERNDRYAEARAAVLRDLAAATR